MSIDYDELFPPDRVLHRPVGDQLFNMRALCGATAEHGTLRLAVEGFDCLVCRSLSGETMTLSEWSRLA